MSDKFAATGTKMQPVTGPSVWNREQLTNDDSWLYMLSDDTRAEIRSNLENIDLSSVQYDQITSANFPLPSFVIQGAAISQQLGYGRGVAKLSGLDVDNYSTAQLKAAYSGICAHIGTTVSQSHKGDYIGEVMDFRNDKDDRKYHNGGEFIMHRDPTADVIGLLSVRKSKTGGASRIMSAGTFHNALLHDYPELMETIYKGFPYRRTTPDRGTTDLYTPYRISVFDFTAEGEFSSHYLPYFSQFYQERDQLPEDHIEVRAQAAINDVLWNRPELYMEYMMETGDMAFVSNRTALHARTDYEDFDEIERARLLLRVWLQLPNMSTLPAHMQMFENRDRADGGIAKQ
jgi:hypothetical protein